MKTKMLGSALLVGGLVLLAFGFLGKDSFESSYEKAKEAIQNTTVSKQTLIVAGGAVCAVAGIGLLMIRQKKK